MLDKLLTNFRKGGPPTVANEKPILNKKMITLLSVSILLTFTRTKLTLSSQSATKLPMYLNPMTLVIEIFMRVSGSINSKRKLT